MEDSNTDQSNNATDGMASEPPAVESSPESAVVNTGANDNESQHPQHYELSPQSFFSLIDYARIRIILVPVHPIKKETFQYYVDLISKFSVVSLGDLTPPDPKAQNTNFHNTNFNDGHLYLNFVTSTNKEHQPLEEFQMHRRVMGVVGIMHCQQSLNLKESYRNFQKMVAKYPTSLVSRCFAFEPAENQADDTKGIIMIPNVGQLGFYMNTMISDMASEMLLSFGTLAKNIESKSIIHSPAMTSPELVAHASESNSNYQQLTSPSVMNVPTLPGNQAPTAPPSAFTAAESLNMAPLVGSPPSEYANPMSGLGASSQNLASPPNSLSAPNAAATGSLNISSSLGLSNVVANMGLGGLLGPEARTKKRTPARAQKLVGDLYLLAGRTTEAATWYSNAIEAMKSNGDYFWQASAMEGYYCALMISAMVRANVAPHALPSIELAPSPNSPLLFPPLTSDVLSSNDPQLRSFLADLPDKYRDIISLYDRALQPSQGCYPLLTILALLKVAKLLADMVRCQFRENITGGAPIPLLDPPKAGITGNVVADAVSSFGGGATVVPAPANKLDVGTWVMKAWGSGIEFLTLQDQIAAVSRMATVCAVMKWERKHAFFLRQVALLVLSTLKVAPNTKPPTQGGASLTVPGNSQGSGGSTGNKRLSGIGSTDDGYTLVGEKIKGAGNGGLLCMKKVCDVLGVGGKDFWSPQHVDEKSLLVLDENDYDWLEEFADESDLVDAVDDSVDSQPASATITFPRSVPYSVQLLKQKPKFGWPDLQSDVLKECIDLAEGSEDYVSTVIFSTRLLRKLHFYLTRQEQLALNATLQRVMMKSHAARTAIAPKRQIAVHDGEHERVDELYKDGDMDMEVLVKSVGGGICGVPVCRKVGVIRQIAIRIPYPHAVSELASPKDATRDPFIYNPFAKNKNMKALDNVPIVLVANEPIYFTIVLANPLAFDLDIQSIYLSTSGVPFQAQSTSTVIPAQSRRHVVRLGGVPLESGTLAIRGCVVRLFGGCVEEEVLPLPKYDMKKKKLTLKLQEFQVIPEQPMLKLETSLESEGALQLFEGERSQFQLQLTNIGRVPINYVALMFRETYAPVATNNDAIEQPEELFEREVYEQSQRAFWHVVSNGIDKTDGNNNGTAVVMPSKPEFGKQVKMIVEGVNLLPGKKMKITVGVFGKYRCTGCNMQVDYAHITPKEADGVEKQYFTRQIVLPVLMTVHRALEMLNFDVLIYNSSELKRQSGSMSVEELLLLGKENMDPNGESENGSRELVTKENQQSSEERGMYCLLTFDVRNLWNRSFEVVFNTNEGDPRSVQTRSSAIVHAGCTKRVILPIRRVHVRDAISSQPIPTPQHRQFVLTKALKLTEAEDRLRRALFWYREELLGGLFNPGRVIAEWQCSPDRSGTFSMRSMYLSRPQLSILKTEEVAFQVSVDTPSSESAEDIATTNGQIVKRLGPSNYQVLARYNVDLVWEVKNRQDKPVKLCLRIQPLQDFNNGHLHVDLEGRVLFGGSLQTVLDEIPSNSNTRFVLPTCFLIKGKYQFIFHAEDTVLAHSIIAKMNEKPTKKDKNKGHQMHIPNTVFEERYFWCNEPFVVDVRDEDEGNV